MTNRGAGGGGGVGMHAAVLYTSGRVVKLGSAFFLLLLFFLTGCTFWVTTLGQSEYVGVCVCVCVWREDQRVCVCACGVYVRIKVVKINELTVRAVGESDPLGR